MSDLLSGRRILVVEDEMLILLMIVGILEDLGCQSVTSAATVEKAVSLIESDFFDAAMLDMNLGGEDSSRVADALSEKAVPFIYSTGNDKRGMGEVARNHIVLHKPFRDADLSAALTQLLS
jgi:CheY-like chemotaxis protein